MVEKYTKILKLIIKKPSYVLGDVNTRLLSKIQTL